MMVMLLVLVDVLLRNHVRHLSDSMFRRPPEFDDLIHQGRFCEVARHGHVVICQVLQKYLLGDWLSVENRAH